MTLVVCTEKDYFTELQTVMAQVQKENLLTQLDSRQLGDKCRFLMVAPEKGIVFLHTKGETDFKNKIVAIAVDEHGWTISEAKQYTQNIFAMTPHHVWNDSILHNMVEAIELAFSCDNCPMKKPQQAKQPAPQKPILGDRPCYFNLANECDARWQTSLGTWFNSLPTLGRSPPPNETTYNRSCKRVVRDRAFARASMTFCSSTTDHYYIKCLETLRDRYVGPQSVTKCTGRKHNNKTSIYCLDDEATQCTAKGYLN